MTEKDIEQLHAGRAARKVLQDCEALPKWAILRPLVQAKAQKKIGQYLDLSTEEFVKMCYYEVWEEVYA